MARVSSQKSSFQHLYDASVQRRTSPSDDNFTSHVCGFCVTSLGLWSSSRSAHQATHQSFQAGTSGATQNYAQVGPSSCAFIFIETAVRIRVWFQGEFSDDVIPLKWQTMKTVFLLALASVRRRSYLHALRVSAGRCVFLRGATQQQLEVSLYAGTWFPCEESTTVTGSNEVRALSASWAYNCQVALPDILSASFWRSSGVFQNSYLQDMACIADGMSTLGPVVVVQQVVDPGHLLPPP